MARSVRKAPFVSTTTAPSEKEDKQRANRRLRRRVKQGHPDTRLDDVSNADHFGKDGRRRIDPSASPELMRK
jgi:hypothetical protein